MDNSHKIVSELVKDFKANEHAYLSPSYQESQVRQDFIDKFFAALGWDVTHTHQKNPYQQEVKIENKVVMETSQRRADYAFAIAPNFDQIKFFVEAKKPARNLANPDDYFQTIRYAWNSKTHISVLTDFEEFHVLDCRYKPNPKDALERRIASFHYSDYINEETFAKIYHLFSREAVLSGSLDLFISTLQKKMAKTAAALQPVDDAFLEELDEYRVVLAKAFKKTNEQLQGEELTEAVQRVIDRLVFIRFLEDKGIEDKQIITLAKQKDSWGRFVTLCKRLEPKYNGLVFKPHRILDSGEFKAPDDKAFAGICECISDPASPYDFNQIPVSILGSIYERFLGKVVHATDKRVKIEEKPEVRKAGGVYYTPENIVRYIVKETVGKLIKGKTPAEISMMAFADIACGSGSFLIEIYQQILDYHVHYYAEHPDEATSDEVFFRDGILKLALKKKKEILVNNIYGVDLDYQATEVTQLSLYLKMLEHATMQDAHQFGLFKERILPDLRQNIICGNSIIGRDIIDGSLFSNVDEPQIKPLDFKDAFPLIMKRGGFDAIVGNPPYVRQELLSDLKSYLQQRYEVYHGTGDLYTYFIERAVKLLKADGEFSIIVANKWMRANFGEPLRRWLIRQHITRIIDFGDLPVFQGVTTYPCILAIKNDGNIGPIDTTKIDSLDNLDLYHYTSTHSFLIEPSELKSDGWTLTDQASFSLIRKLKSVGIPLSEYVQEKIFFGLKTGLNDAFVIDEPTKNRLIQEHDKSIELIQPFILGRNVKRYESLIPQNYLILIPNGWTKNKSEGERDKWNWFQKEYPAIARHLLPFREMAIKRGDKGEYWWELRPCAYYSEFAKPKIIYPNICKRPEFAFDRTGVYTNQKCFIIPCEDLYLLGILNSSITYFLFRRILPKLRGDFFEPSYIYLKDFPIYQIKDGDTESIFYKDKITSLVLDLLSIKVHFSNTVLDVERDRLTRRSNSLYHQIDEAVYALYGLSEKEVRIVENS